jgi:hypothetical protein
MTRDVPSLIQDSDGHTDAVLRLIVNIFLGGELAAGAVAGRGFLFRVSRPAHSPQA